MSEGRIKNTRAEIDEVDAEILRLLNKRAEIALRVGAAKTGTEAALCDTGRERDVLERLGAENPGPFEDDSIAAIFQRIIDESLHLQQSTYQSRLPADNDGERKIPLPPESSRIAILGERGTFSEEAALAALGQDCETVSFPTFEKMFRAIEEGSADYVLAPLENSLIGSVHRCYDLLLDSSLKIAAEIILPVSHYLVGCREATLETVRAVESHPAALAQCERFFSAHPQLKRVTAEDTAGSVRRAVESGDPARAAIGSKRAAEIYNGKILREHIEDHPGNYTRFALLSADAEDSGEGSKISLVVRLTHRPGSLHDALRPIVRRGIDLLKIESRPISGTPGEFNFYLDLRAPASERELRGALDDIREQAVEARFLGRYSTVRVGGS